MSRISATNHTEPRYDAFSEFKNLNSAHQALTIVVSIFISIFTLGVGTYFITPLLIGRFRQLELKNTPLNDAQIHAAHKADKIAKQKTGLDDSPQEDSTDNEGINPVGDDTHTIEILRDVVKAYIQLMNPNEKDAFIVWENYKSLRKSMDPDFHFEDSQIADIVQKIEELLNEGIQFPYPLENGLEVMRFETVGDGSCAFHALLGEPVEGVYTCNAEEKREIFCNFLKNYKNGEEHPYINTVLKEYLVDAEGVPQNFKNALEKELGEQGPGLLEDYQKKYEALHQKIQDKQSKIRDLQPSPPAELDMKEAEKVSRDLKLYAAQSDAIVEEFIQDKRIREAYFAYMKDPTTYMLQDELMIMAECFNKRVRLFQKGWGKDEAVLQQGVINENGKDEVCIYFKGGNFGHYERAIIRPREEVSRTPQ